MTVPQPDPLDVYQKLVDRQRRTRDAVRAAEARTLGPDVTADHHQAVQDARRAHDDARRIRRAYLYAMEDPT